MQDLCQEIREKTQKVELLNKQVKILNRQNPEIEDKLDRLGQDQTHITTFEHAVFRCWLDRSKEEKTNFCGGH